MKWFAGVDGGGSKTDFAVSAADGIPVSQLRRGGSSYQALGVEEAAAFVAAGIRDCLADVGARPEDCAGCCVGMPCFGENAEQDRAVTSLLCGALSPAPVYLVNDVEVGWAGSLQCRPGIHIVSGTGSIAFGRGYGGETARCGGWTEFFGDEGSCYWIGREGMSLFTKEADGRAARGALYEQVRQAFDLEEDSRFIDAVLHEIAPYRDQVALFQQHVLRAAQSGDAAALALYEAAARELSAMAAALMKRLTLSRGGTPVSYSGGLFQAGELILRPLGQQISALGGVLQEPLGSPLEGALRLAIEHFDGRNETCF